MGKVFGTIDKKSEGWKISNIEGDTEKLKYVLLVSEKVFNFLEKGKGVKLYISSDIPPGSGLGSSSAVTTAAADAVALALGEKLETEEIINLAFQTEKEIQGSASRAGVSVAAEGGFLKIEEDSIDKLYDLPNPNIVIGYTGEHADTGKLVRKVKQRKMKKPNIYEPMIKTIGQNTRNGVRALREKKFQELGVLMNVNQTLLEGLGVSTASLKKLIETAKDAGAVGAKITGAGGGGCMIALSNEKTEEIVEAIRKESGTPIRTEIGKEGLKH